MSMVRGEPASTVRDLRSGPVGFDPFGSEPLGSGASGSFGSGSFAAVPFEAGPFEAGSFEGQDAADWQERALCAQTDPESFFPEKGGSTREAKKICTGCEVRSECLEYALGHDERFGIWGGLSERERRRLKKQAV